MGFSSIVALRYLQSSRSSRYFSWITVLSLLGLAIGVAALIVVLSVINGFEFELRNRFLQVNSHIMAYRYPAGMQEPEKWAAIIKRDFSQDVLGSSPFIHYETMSKNGSIMQGVLVRGISPTQRTVVQDLSTLVDPPISLQALQKEIDDADKGLPPPETPGVIVGSGLLGILSAKVGGSIFLIAPTASKMTDLQRFKVLGVYNSGLKHYDNRLVLMSLSAAKKFFNMGDIVTGLEIGLKDPDKSPEVTKAMEEKYNLSFREWQSFNRPVFEAMEREKSVIAVIVGLVGFVAAFNILTTVFVSVTQRQRDISVLKALGARNGQIMRLFLIQSTFIGVIGSVIGIALALVISYVLQTWPLIDLPEPYFLKTLPIHYSFSVYLAVSFGAILVCIVAGLYPALVASEVVPTEGIGGTGQAL